MNVEIIGVGGYSESGRNMSAVRIGDEVVLLDMGLHLPNYIKLNDDAVDQWKTFTESELKRAGAIPDDRVIKDWRDDVAAIVVSHAHLDHIGATPYLASKYDASIFCTPFSAAILRNILSDEKLSLPNKIVELSGRKKVKLSQSITLEFVPVTHSTPQDVIVVLHTPVGLVVYANDYKLDDSPTLGRPVNRDYLRKLGKTGVFLLVQDCLYADVPERTPSEKVAKEKLEKVFSQVARSDKAIVVSTFSSHVARLNTIAELGKKIGRKVVFVGRSMYKYCSAARDAGVIDLFKKAKILKYSRQAKRKLRQVKDNKHAYLLVVSGHQGEPQSALNKMIEGIYPWNFEAGDIVIFSSKIIPADINIEQRRVMDEKLCSLGVRIFDNVHVSGHLSGKDIADVVSMLKPEHLVPVHGEPEKMRAFQEIVKKLGYSSGKTLHLLKNGEKLVLS